MYATDRFQRLALACLHAMRAVGPSATWRPRAQVVATLALVAYTMMAVLGASGPAAIVLGGGLALSSTAVAMQARSPRTLGANSLQAQRRAERALCCAHGWFCGGDSEALVWYAVSAALVTGGEAVLILAWLTPLCCAPRCCKTVRRRALATAAPPLPCSFSRWGPEGSGSSKHNLNMRHRCCYRLYGDGDACLCCLEYAA